MEAKGKYMTRKWGRLFYVLPRPMGTNSPSIHNIYIYIYISMNEQREINRYFLLYNWRGYGRVEGDMDSAQLRDEDEDVVSSMVNTLCM